jgi:glycerophosphoryl diester phosphodiesterase
MSIVAASVLVTSSLAAPGPASAEPANPWVGRRPLVIAHQGGVHEAPSNTLYAFKQAIAHGADALEFDVHETADGQLVVIHDDTTDRTTGSPGWVRDQTLAELQSLDAAFCWHPGAGDACDETVTGGSYPLRGVATGQTPPPAGFATTDFRIPTLQELLETVGAAEQRLGRGVILELEVKYNPLATAAPPALPFDDKVVALLSTPAFGRDAADTLVASTYDDTVTRLRLSAALRGASFSYAAPIGAVAVFAVSSAGPLAGVPMPLYQVFAVPRKQPETGVTVIDDGGDIVRDAHVQGLAVHAWTINDPAEMANLLDLGVDGIITDRPTELRAVIDSR